MLQGDDLFFRSVSKHKTFDPLTHQTSIGSDPEFGFLDAKTHRQVHAKKVVPYSDSTILGTDGHPDIAELRPPYTHDPLLHLDYIKRIMQFGKAMMESYIAFNEHPIIAVAGSMIRDDAMGGHIHLGREANLGIFPKILDTYLMPILAALDNPRVFKKRVKGRMPYGDREGYGRLGDFREKNYGIEYRTPQSWLGSESIARGVLVAAWVLTNAQNITQTPNSSYRRDDYYNHNYKGLRRTALFALDKILHLAAPHGREAFLSVCSLKGLIKERKRWRTHNIFVRWNLASEAIQPPIFSVYPIENPILKYILREYRQQMLPMPLHFEAVDHSSIGSAENVRVNIDPATAGLINIKELKERLYGSYYLAGYLDEESFKIAPAGGGINIQFTPNALTESVLCDAFSVIKNTWRFQDADSNDCDVDDE